MKYLIMVLFSFSVFFQPLYGDLIQKYGDLLKMAKKYYDTQVTTYYSYAIVQERHDGKLREKERVRLFFRKNPLGQYYQFMKGKFEGLRISYVPSRDGKTYFMARETGWRSIVGVRRWGFHSIIKTVLYPHIFDVNQYHIGFIIDEGLNAYEWGVKNGKIRVLYVKKKYEPLFKKEMIETLAEFTIDKPQGGIIYKKALMMFDPKTHLPFYLRLYDFDGNVLAYYYFKVFVPNIKIPDSVYDLHNPPPKPPVPDPKDS